MAQAGIFVLPCLGVLFSKVLQLLLLLRVRFHSRPQLNKLTLKKKTDFLPRCVTN